MVALLPAFPISPRMRKTEQALKETTYLGTPSCSGTNGRTVDFERAAVPGEIRGRARQPAGQDTLLASASHAIWLQPLNAARLFASRTQSEPGSEEGSQEAILFLHNLESAPELRKTFWYLLDISKL